MRIDVSGQLTIYFDCPFWVGVFEVYLENTIQTCKVVFGTEPKDGEIYNLILTDYYNLNFSRPTTVDENYKRPKAVNPKRMQRQVSQQTHAKGIGTKSQQSIQKQREENKIQRKQVSKKQMDEEKQLKFQMKQLKKKEKHKGH